MKSFRQYLIEGGRLNVRWSNWLNSVNTEHPNPRVEPSAAERIRTGDEGRIPKEPGAFELTVAASQRESNRRLLKRLQGGPLTPSNPRSAFSNTDLRTNIPIGGFYSISHAANLINAKTDNQKPKPDSLLVSSNRTEEGDLEFKIRKTTFEDVQDIHRYILPAGATTLNSESGDGHMQKPGASHVLSISDASRVIREHMLSQIKTGKKDMVGQTVAEAHGVEL